VTTLSPEVNRKLPNARINRLGNIERSTQFSRMTFKLFALRLNELLDRPLQLLCNSHDRPFWTCCYENYAKAVWLRACSVDSGLLRLYRSFTWLLLQLLVSIYNNPTPYIFLLNKNSCTVEFASKHKKLMLMQSPTVWPESIGELRPYCHNSRR
jgi:hypothetical protein